MFFNHHFQVARRAFSLIEMLVVLAIISVLAAILFPVFGSVRGRARQISCASNLHQIGLAFSAYLQDYDGRFPRAIDVRHPDFIPYWQTISPEFAAAIPALPMLTDALAPYANSKSVFRCPGDIGFVYSDYSFVRLDAFPSSYEKYGNSYLYHTKLAALQIPESQLPEPTRIRLMNDLAGFWHGTLTPLENRYNVLFIDGHVKNINRSQMDEVEEQKLR